MLLAYFYPLLWSKYSSSNVAQVGRVVVWAYLRVYRDTSGLKSGALCVICRRGLSEAFSLTPRSVGHRLAIRGVQAFSFWQERGALVPRSASTGPDSVKSFCPLIIAIERRAEPLDGSGLYPHVLRSWTGEVPTNRIDLTVQYSLSLKIAAMWPGALTKKHVE